MSDKARYFQTLTGRVIVRQDGGVPLDRTCIEVRVAPLDAIVIRRDELPKVEWDYLRRMPVVHGDRYQADVDHREQALIRLAVAEYLREHPPVDEAKVKALADALRREDGVDPWAADRIARGLIASGQVQVTES